MLFRIGDSRQPEFRMKQLTTAPDVIARYFNFANTGQVEEASRCFSAIAVVVDEEKTHSGIGAIRRWIGEATGKYHPQVEMIRVEENDGTFVITGRVSGDFPGSPLDLEFRFILADDGISKLHISQPRPGL